MDSTSVATTSEIKPPASLGLNWFQRGFRLLERPLLLLRFWHYRRRYGRLALETIDGVPLLVLPDVFNPVITLTGEFLVRTLAVLPLNAVESDRTPTVLDMGTGSGVGAVFAARRGAQVTAVDINPEAVRCARLNALLNNLEAQIEVRCGNLFEPVAGQQFDIVLFNPPFYKGQPQDELDQAWRGLDIFERFSSQLGGALKPGGQAYLVLSSLGDCNELLQQLQVNSFEIDVIAQKSVLREIITVYRVRQPL